MRRWIDRLQAWLRIILDPARLAASPDMRFLGRTLWLATVVGVACGLIGVAFVAATDLVERLLIERVAGVALLRAAGERPAIAATSADFPFALALIPGLGALLAGLLLRLAPEAQGGGVDAALRAYHHEAAHVRRRVAFIKLAASALTLGSGGSGGREGPTMQIGAAIGAGLARVFTLDERERRLLFIAGIAAGIAAVFRTPLGAALFAVEVLYREGFESDALIPAVLSSVAGYTVTVLFFGEHTLFYFPRSLHFVPQHLPLYVLLGVVCAASGRAFISSLRRVRALVVSSGIPVWAAPAIGGLAMGVIASCAAFVASRTFDFGVTGLGMVGSGYGMLQAVFSHAAWMPAGFAGFAFFVALAILKVACTACTVGSGGSAGDFAPALVVGGLSGAALALGVDSVFPGLDVDPAAFALVGMAAMFGGAAHVPLAALVLVSEMAGSYALLVPTMLAIGVTSILFRHRSLYEAQRRSPHRARTTAPGAETSGSFEVPTSKPS